jgi:hypothetical protein
MSKTMKKHVIPRREQYYLRVILCLQMDMAVSVKHTRALYRWMLITSPEALSIGSRLANGGECSTDEFKTFIGEVMSRNNQLRLWLDFEMDFSKLLANTPPEPLK